MINKSKLKEWFNRYKYAELSAICAVLTSSQFSRFFDTITTAYVISTAEYFAFYGTILFLNYKQLIKKNKDLNKSISKKEMIVLAQNLILEFGYPAALDLLIIRPFFMYWMPILIGNYFVGVILGKISADSIFYTCTIINYEWIKRKR